MPYNYAAESFHTKQTLQQTFFKGSTLLQEKWSICVFEPFGGQVRGNVHLRLIGKLVVDFLLVITELFSLGLRARSKYQLKIAIFEATGSVCPKISGTRGRTPPTILRVRKIHEFRFHMV